MGRGSTRVGAFKRSFEPQESNIRKSSRDTSRSPQIADRGSLDAGTESDCRAKKLPTLKLADGTIISHSGAILAWVREQQERGDALKRVA